MTLLQRRNDVVCRLEKLATFRIFQKEMANWHRYIPRSNQSTVKQSSKSLMLVVHSP